MSNNSSSCPSSTSANYCWCWRRTTWTKTNDIRDEHINQRVIKQIHRFHTIIDQQYGFCTIIDVPEFAYQVCAIFDQSINSVQGLTECMCIYTHIYIHMCVYMYWIFTTIDIPGYAEEALQILFLPLSDHFGSKKWSIVSLLMHYNATLWYLPNH